MSMLTLRLQKHLEGETTSAGAVATLYCVADETGAAIRGGLRLDVTIPANNGGSGKSVDVKPGHWLVEATLPSGEILNEEIAVPAGEEVSLTLHALEHSPHEWLGWQHLIGNIEGAETLEQIRGRARELAISVASEALPKELDRKLADKIADSLGNLFGEAVVHLARKFGPFLKKFTIAPSVPSREPATLPSLQVEATPVVAETISGEPAVGLCEEYPPLGDARAWEAILDLSHAPLSACPYSRGSREEALYLYQLGELTQPSVHDFAHVAWGGERFAVSLPIPWQHTVRHERVPVEMMVRLQPMEKTVQIGVAVLDSEFGTLAGLMTTSTLPKAKIVVEQAHELLFEKGNNPLAAAAGGYILLATSGPEEHPAWHGWIDNLYHRFPTLPDGAVLKASLRLLYPTDQCSYDDARAALFTAFDRGIPYFSAGVARLLDGLTLFAADDSEAKEKMTRVQRIAQRLDLSQAFTVIRLNDRARRA